MQRMLIGAFLVIAGLSGQYVLRGTNSGLGLALVGVIYAVWGFAQENSSEAPPSASTRPEETKIESHPHMTDSEVEEWVARELGRMQNPDDLIVTVCERTGLKWDGAKEFIKRVQERKGSAIDNRQRGVSLAFGIPTILTGSFLLFGCASALVTAIARGNAMMFYPRLYIGFGLGLAMTTGGLYGIFRTKK